MSLSLSLSLSLGDSTAPSTPSYGPELVTNGEFSVDSAGWTAWNGGSLAVNAGKLEATGASGTGAYYLLNLVLEPLTAYQVVADIVASATSDVTAAAFNNAFDAFRSSVVTVPAGTSATASFIMTTVAAETTANLLFRNSTGAGTFSLDNVSVKEVL